VALNGNDLGDLMKTTMDAATAVTAGDRQAIFRALGNAIVNYIKANMVVTVTTSTPGASAGALTLPGSGTGTVT
jgi:hypothetical protein